MLDTFRDATGTSLLDRDEIRKSLSWRKNDRSRSHIFRGEDLDRSEDILPKNSDPRSRERGKPRIISLGVSRAVALSTCQSHLILPIDPRSLMYPKVAPLLRRGVKSIALEAIYPESLGAKRFEVRVRGQA